MFPLVQILHSEGFQITGSDVNDGDIIATVRKMGIPVTIGHHQNNVEYAEALVVTAALLPGNPEVLYAERNGIPIIPRADLLGYITYRFSNSIGVSGTHGKTTTTSMLTTILLFAGINPAAVIGGKLNLIGGYGRSGSSDMIVVEACEYVDTYHKLKTDYAIILNIDADHLDYFITLERVIASFRTFASGAKKLIIANRNDANTLKALENLDKMVIYFGEDTASDYTICDVTYSTNALYSFSLKKADGNMYGPFNLMTPGRHNVYNGAAAATLALELGCSQQAIQEGFMNFRGAGRRFEILGSRRGVTVADDYAHHPAEISVTLQAARDMGFRKIIAVFQPFTFSRTKQLLTEFTDALMVADQVVLTEIMGSREKNTFGVYSTDLAERIPNSVWFSDFEAVADWCVDYAKEGDLIITLGCGDVYKVARSIYEKLQ
ncbi:MAG: UDP-N-acetylmuramate--L-alanine ligase [Oscillospiraceae bacterium]|nr:UDP-N-acetylmuramate--L-alanine ligase [Oscillospiraceae bacterium]